MLTEPGLSTEGYRHFIETMGERARRNVALLARCDETGDCGDDSQKSVLEVEYRDRNGRVFDRRCVGKCALDISRECKAVHIANVVQRWRILNRGNVYVGSFKCVN